MRTPSRRLPPFILLLAAVVASPGLTAQSAKPLLSEKVQALLSEGGRPAAQAWMDQVFPAESDRWDLDMQGIMMLGAGYMQAGEMQNAEWVMNTAAAIAMSAIEADAVAAGVPIASPTTRSQAAPSSGGDAENTDFYPAGPRRDDLRSSTLLGAPTRGLGGPVHHRTTGSLTGRQRSSRGFSGGVMQDDGERRVQGRRSLRTSSRESCSRSVIRSAA